MSGTQNFQSRRMSGPGSLRRPRDLHPIHTGVRKSFRTISGGHMSRSSRMSTVDFFWVT